MKFSQRIVYGVAGNAFFEVCLVRGETQRCEARALTLSVIEETAHLGVDFELANYEVHFLRGECFATILVPLLDSGLALQGDMARSWRPVRDARLLLHLPQSTDDVTAGVMGDVTECNIKIVNSNKWPGEHLKQQNDLSLVSIFKAYVLHVLYENLETDCWWFVGVLVRAFNTSITTNVLSLMLVDLAILGRSLDWSFSVAAGFLGVELLAHITGYQHPLCERRTHHLLAFLDARARARSPCLRTTAARAGIGSIHRG
jgi:hypothetical protein